MSDAPDIKDELERKASETLARALSQLSRGELSSGAARAALTALWDAVSGLVSRELMDLIAESLDAIDTVPDTPRCRVLGMGSNVAVVELPEPGLVRVRAMMIGDGVKSAKTIVADDTDTTLVEAASAASRVVTSLLQKGFRELS